jgi:hypothetical protein
VYHAEPGSPSEHALKLLGSAAADAAVLEPVTRTGVIGHS